MEKMKLAILCPKPPWFNEGQAKVVKEHALRLSKKFNLEIFCCDPSGKETGIHNWNNINVHVYKGYTNSYLFSLRLFKDLKKRKFDIIHAHGFTIFMPLVASLLKRNTKKLIFQPHYHSTGSNFWFKILRKIYDPTVGKFIISRSDKILCNSEYEKNKLEEKYNPDKRKLQITYHGINLSEFKKARPFNLRTKDKKIIIYIGRLEKYKNIHLIIETIKHLKNYHLFIIGTGPYKESLQRLINKLNLKNQIEILENVEDKDIPKWYKTCDIFITLSEVESFGLTVIEALASGKPVIVNYATSLAELADKFKEIIPVNAQSISPEELAEVIKKSSNKTKTNKINPEFKTYNWDSIIKEIVKVYDEK